MTPVCEHSIRRIVEFSETDMAGIVHFAQFFRFMEAAEHALWRAAGLSVVANEGELAAFGWPRVSVECDFAAPLRFEEPFEVIAVVREIRTRALRFGFVIRKVTPEPTPCARGGITAVCVTKTETGGMKAVPIPDAVRGRFAPIDPARAAELGFTQ